MRTETWQLLDRLRAAGLVVEIEAGRLCVQPADRLTDDLRTAIRKQKADLLECLRLEEPAPAYTPEEQAQHDAMRRQMAEVVTDAELLAWIHSMGAEPYAADGALRIRNGAGVEAPIREVVRARQDGLLALLLGRAPPAAVVDTAAG